ncbi:LppA family lipoprotein [Mycobacteroides abscessus]|uniref:LppA family lipoprotein n=1 Tax=Mycobacteroides abscessus TaxID=36809 RepID=UPI0034CD40F5
MDNRYAPTPPTEAAKALEELKTLPSLEDTKAQLEAAIKSIKDAIGAVIPETAWREQDNGAKANCSKPYDRSDGQSVYLPNSVAARVDISEQEWSAVLAATKGAAERIGAINSQVMQDKSGNHDVRFYGPAGIAIGIGYAGNLVISGYTGCRLPAAKK